MKTKNTLRLKSHSKMVLIGVLLLLSSTIVSAQNQILGLYMGHDETYKVEVLPNENKFIGWVTWALRSPELKKQEVLILKDLTYEQDEWEGILVMPESKKEYKVNITCPDEKKIILKVKWGIFSKKIEWSRTQ